MNYPIPENEAERLNTLRGYGILDTHPEDRFDELARLANIICGTPSSVISLVDEHRQWFKSRTGITACQTPREDAICAHAIITPDVLVVPDATQDPRFANYPQVLGEPHLRFYAGAPLVAPNGHRLGALCVIDYVPRQLSPDQLESLRILSRQVMLQVELGKRLQELRIALQEREDLEHELEKVIQDFQEAKDMIHTLENLVPICYMCKKVRDDRGYWEHVEAYIAKSIGVDPTSSICPECLQNRFGDGRDAGEKPHPPPNPQAKTP
ncbi:MAG: GAF domain-containing protein [Verrucomicrobiota bacterium]|jgi:GAF domain-containing protein